MHREPIAIRHDGGLPQQPARRIAAAVRSPAKAADLAARGVEIRLADYERPETLLAAFDGADELLLVSSTGPDDAVARGVIAGGAGQGRITSATRAALPDAAAVVLTRDDQAGKVYDLTGDTAWSLPEPAAESAAQSGRPVTYAAMPAEQYRQILAGAGLPDFVTDLIVDADVHVSHGARALLRSLRGEDHRR
ncbi:hypothetical protein ACIRNI_29615 [Streptomyces sp. NPDC093546]|uniref:hypothetical protein n=1 Tax=Streptomyces sp. NPDC093546 TaxID=3366040 RepID=UPI003801CC36